MGSLSGMTGETLTGNHARDPICGTTSLLRVQTDDPVLKMEHLQKLEAPKDPLQIAYFMAHVYNLTETLQEWRV